MNKINAAQQLNLLRSVSDAEDSLVAVESARASLGRGAACVVADAPSLAGSEKPTPSTSR